MDINNIRSLILDMDGVLWRENTPIGDLPAIFHHFRQKDLKVILATNNGTKTPQQYVQKMAGFGVVIDESQIITSSMGIAYLMHKKFPQGGAVFILGEIGLISALKEDGFTHSETGVLAVAAGMDRNISFPKLSQAALLIRSGLPFYFTNPDRTYPTPKGLIPGAGAILAALEAATDVSAIIAGKPSPTLFEFSLERLGTKPDQTLVVGDRLETDILGGQRAACKTAVVLSGVAERTEAENWRPKVDLIVDSLSNLIP
jgi:4-nitrophenyl phosphatase